MNYKIYNQKAEEVGNIELSDSLFNVKVNEALIHQVAVAQMANMRQVLAHTKDRSEVRGGGKKPWKQKGTGRARVGSNRSPIWIGGGVTFGPTKDRNFSKKVNKKMKQKSFFMVFSDKILNNSLVILDELNVDVYKTKIFNEILKNLEKKVLKKEDKEKRSLLLINSEKNEKVKNSSRNLSNIKVINLENINLIDLLNYKSLIITKDVVEKMEKIYKKEVK